MSNTNIFNLTGVGSNVRFGKAGSRLKMNAGVLEVRNAADDAYADFKAYNGTFANNLTVTGNLTVNGTTTTVNSTTITIQDPIINLGGGVDGAAPTTGDANNRGVEFQWYDTPNTTARTGFFGWDNATGKFVFKPDGTNLGTAKFDKVEAGDVTITGTTISNGTGDLTVTPASGSDLILSSLGTTASLLFGDASKKIKNATALAWNSATNTLTANSLTFSGSTIGTTSNADLTLTPDGTGKIIASTLTATQVVYAGASKELTGSANFVWDNANNKLTATNITSSGTADLATVKVSTLTSTRVVFTTTNGQLTDDANLTYASSQLNVGNTGIKSGEINTSTGNLKLAPSSSIIDANTSTIINVVNPVNAQDAATKNYVDTQVGTGAKVGHSSVAQTNVTQSIKGKVHRIKIYVTTAYAAGGTISVSDGSNTLVAVADVDAQTTGAYVVDMFETYAVATTFTLTVGGSPASGAAEWMVEYFTTAG